jgi:hypothetical protein
MKQYTKVINGLSVTKTRKQIVIKKDGMNIFNPTEEMIFTDGWIEYIPNIIEPSESNTDIKDPYSIMYEIIFEQYNSRTDISDKEALDRSVVIYDWEHYIGKSLKTGQVVVHEGNVYRVRQDITEVLDVYPPSLVTASLYEVIVLTATGTKDDPILYTPPMEIYKDKYYTQNDVLYLCTRDSGTALSHNLQDLINIYVNKV